MNTHPVLFYYLFNFAVSMLYSQLTIIQYLIIIRHTHVVITFYNPKQAFFKVLLITLSMQKFKFYFHRKLNWAPTRVLIHSATIPWDSANINYMPYNYNPLVFYFLLLTYILSYPLFNLRDLTCQKSISEFMHFWTRQAWTDYILWLVVPHPMAGSPSI